MGWWGEGIRDGDTPLDMETDLCTWAGVEPDAYGSPCAAGLTRGHLNTNTEWLAARFIQEYNGLEQVHGLQVLGYWIVKHGSDLSEYARNEIIKACEYELQRLKTNQDRWCNPESRVVCVSELKELIEKYPAKGQELVDVANTT